MDRTYIYHLEHNNRRPSYALIARLAAVLDTTHNYLAWGIEPDPIEEAGRKAIKGIDERELFAITFTLGAMRSGIKPSELEAQLRHDQELAEKLRKELDHLLLHYSAIRLSLERARVLVEEVLS